MKGGPVFFSVFPSRHFPQNGEKRFINFALITCQWNWLKQDHKISDFWFRSGPELLLSVKYRNATIKLSLSWMKSIENWSQNWVICASHLPSHFKRSVWKRILVKSTSHYLILPFLPSDSHLFISCPLASYFWYKLQSWYFTVSKWKFSLFN